MPELPDITVYVERMDALLTGRVLKKVRLATPFWPRTLTESEEHKDARKL